MGPLITGIIVYVAAVFIYAFFSAVGFLRLSMMLAGILVMSIVGFKNAYLDVQIFSQAWWNSAGLCWAGASVFFMFFFADLAWQPHYYTKYSVTESLFGTASVEEKEDYDVHVFRYTILSAILGAAVIGFNQILQDYVVKKPGYLMCGIVGLVCAAIFVFVIARRVIKARH